MQILSPFPRAAVHSGLTGLAWGLAQAVWLLVSLVSFVVLITLAVFFWDHYQVAPCQKPNLPCPITLEWLNTVGFPPWLLAGLHVIGLLLPSLVWMALGVAIAVSKPH